MNDNLKTKTSDNIVHLYGSFTGEHYVNLNKIDSEANGVTTQNDSTDNLKNYFDDKFGQISKQLSKHDKKQSDERKELSSKLDLLQAENNYFRRQMIEKYTPQKLQIGSLIVASVMLICIGFSIFADIDLIHPLLSGLIFFTAIIFHIMALLMVVQDRKSRIK
jgi:hypothetical protein